MSSWRDGASPEAQQDLDQLLGAVLGFAQRQLRDRGEFYPYAAAIGDAGQAEMIAVRPDATDEHPLASDVIRSCRAALVGQRDYIRAGAIVAVVCLTEGGEAIQVDLEHAEGQALTVLLPYTKHRRGKSIDYGQLRALGSERQVWSDLKAVTSSVAKFPESFFCFFTYPRLRVAREWFDRRTCLTCL